MPRFARASLIVIVSGFLASVSTGQQASDEIQLRNWAAPPFWSPSLSRQLPPAENAREQLSIERATAPAVATPAFAFVAIAPCRQYNSLNFTPLLQGVNRSVTLTGVPCGIPAGAVAVSANITVFNIIGATGNAVFKVDTVSPPLVAWINYPPTEAQRGNAGVVALNGSGQIIVQVAQGGGQVDFVVDVNGYYTATGIVNSLNALNGDVTLAAGTDLSLGAVGQTLTLSANSASANTANTLVRRDGSGNFSAQTVTLGGNLALPAAINSTAGVITSGGSPFLHTFGTNNTFVGLNAGNFTMTGFNNTASGAGALFRDTTGGGNTASGDAALYANATGNNNTASGFQALYNNATGSQNTANGVLALASNNSFNNTASGYNALRNTTGSNNIAVGSGAGLNVTTGSNNIDIGNAGVAAESNAIRIGTVGAQTAAFIAGAYAVVAAGGAAVYVNSSGQLGTTTSSRRFKEDIREIAEESDGLMRLRPVAFKYKPEIDPTGLAQYGLIAEEVAEVYPDLVAYDRDGRPETVRYHLVNALLLNEVQKQHQTIQEQRKQIAGLRKEKDEQVRALEARLAALEAALRVTVEGR